MNRHHKNIQISLSILLIGAILWIGYRYPYTNLSKQNNKDCHLPIERLEQALFNAKEQQAITQLLLKHQLFSKEFLNVKEATSEQGYQQTAASLFEMGQDPTIRALYEESSRQFPEDTTIIHPLQKAFYRLKKYYPTIRLPKVYTMITGMSHDLYVSNRLIVIGLDCFLGQNPSFSMHHLPKYIADTYDPASIASKIMLLYTQQFNATDPSDKSLLAEMLYYGKSFFLVKMLLPDIPDHLLLGYTEEQLREVNKYKTIIWDHFIENELLYNTNDFVKNNYILPRPSTSEIGPSCPGSIGKWLGWEIIKSYMQKNKSKKVNDLMEAIDNPTLLRHACYQPKDER
ncbi:gliding motility lipoprotein GldB [Cardinium endosymbiont of Philonthus spinipes]|uniref:gliding motility protein GldB-related protein n=1 Tax=Cardinium endosymbiont of Philonthus spinipes TaxID=3077941 RepID=UPI00313E528B